jgi:hypothetical protein
VARIATFAVNAVPKINEQNGSPREAGGILLCIVVQMAEKGQRLLVSPLMSKY